MVFVLDNYDSFTYNLVQYMGELGAEMIIRRNDELTVEEVEALSPERILLSPGPCTPQEAGISIARSGTSPARFPSLAFALATRPSARPLAATWCARRKLMHGKTSEVEHDGKTIFRRHRQPHDLHALSLAHRCRGGSAR